MNRQLVKQVIHERGATARHDAFALMRGVDPISDRTMTVRPIDWMTPERADDLAIQADGGVRPLLTLELLQPRRDVVASLRGRIRAIHPREPFAQIRSVAIG